MSLVTANGAAVLTARIEEPLEGTWVADLDLDSHEVLEGAVAIDFGGDVVFTGTVLGTRTGLDSGRSNARVVGGAGGLAKQLPFSAYYVSPMSLVLQQIAEAAGESLDDGSDDLSQDIRAHYHRLAGPAHRALAALAASTGRSWRVQRDGRLWFGTNTFPEIADDHTEVDRDARVDAILVAPTLRPTMRPGVTVDGRKVGHVTTYVGPQGLRQRVDFEHDRLLRSFRRFVEAVGQNGVDYRGRYPCTVLKQHEDLSLDLMPDDPLVGAGTGGIYRVPIRHGLPGIEVEVVEGARVELGYEAGDPTRPYAADFGPGSLKKLNVTASTQVSIVAPDVIAGDGLLPKRVLREGDKLILGAETGAVAFVNPADPTLAKLRS